MRPAWLGRAGGRETMLKALIVLLMLIYLLLD